MSKTLFEKIWDKHVVDTLPDGTIQLYIDRLYCHEVTSPQAFAGLRARGLKPFRPAQITCMPDHNIPTLNQDKPIEDPISKNQVDTLEENAKYFGLTYYGLQHPKNGIIHVVAGKNFGSGSSREHAAWAIAGYGFRVVVSSFFADIHKNNELNNFVLPVVVSEPFLKELFDSISANPKMEVEVNLPEQTITNKATGKIEHFEINAYKKHCLMNGLDDIDFLVENKDKIEAYEKARN